MRMAAREVCSERRNTIVRKKMEETMYQGGVRDKLYIQNSHRDVHGL
jgi:hypothetical protein